MPQAQIPAMHFAKPIRMQMGSSLSMPMLLSIALAACGGGGSGTASGNGVVAPVNGGRVVIGDTALAGAPMRIADTDTTTGLAYAPLGGDADAIRMDNNGGQTQLNGGIFAFVHADGTALQGGVTAFGTLTWAPPAGEATGQWVYTPDTARIGNYFTGAGQGTAEVEDGFTIRYADDTAASPISVVREYTVIITAPVSPPPDPPPPPPPPDPPELPPGLPGDLPARTVPGQYIRFYAPDAQSGITPGFYFHTDNGDGNLDNDLPDLTARLQSASVLAGNDFFLLDGRLDRDLDSSPNRAPGAAPSLTGGGGDDVYQVDLATITAHTPRIIITDVDTSDGAGAGNILVFTGAIAAGVGAVEVDNRDAGNNFSVVFYDDSGRREVANRQAEIAIAFPALPDFDIHYDGVDYTALDAADAAALQTALAADIA